MDIKSAKRAAQEAQGAIAELIPEAEHTTLEGIEQDADRSTWIVIVSYNLPPDAPQTRLASLVTANRRKYKRLTLDSDTYSLQKMEPYDAAA